MNMEGQKCPDTPREEISPEDLRREEIALRYRINYEELSLFARASISDIAQLERMPFVRKEKEQES